ncbi:MAG: hypothetical protein WDW36_004991 [Sanguina aurantia]
MLHQLRWRKPPRDHRRLWLALAIALVLHVWFGWVIWEQMRPAPLASVAAPQHDDAMEIRFIEMPAPAAAPPLALPPPQKPPSANPSPPRAAAARPRPPARAEPAEKDALTIRMPATTPASAPPATLFDKSGQVILPASATSAPAAPEAAYVERMPTDADKVMQHTTPVKYTPTRFEKYWHRTTVVDDTLQKAVDSTTATHTFNLPHGIHIHCSVSLAAAGGGCGGDPPPPPSKKDGDERLSMASARPIATDPHPPVPPTIEACIAMYRAAKPLEHGCPIDTPNRSVDKDIEDRARAAADPSARHVQPPASASD